MQHTRHLTCKNNPRETLRCCLCYFHSQCEIVSSGESRIPQAQRDYDWKNFWTWIKICGFLIGLFILVILVVL